MEYDVAVPDGLLMGGTSTFTLDRPTVVHDSNNIGSIVTVTVSVEDIFGLFDTVGTKTRDVAELAATTVLTATTDTKTIIDAVGATPPRTLFVGSDTDGTGLAKAQITIAVNTADVRNAGNTVTTLW